MICFIIFFIIFFIIYIYFNFLCKTKIKNTIKRIKYSKGIPNIIFRTTNTFTVPFLMEKECNKKWIELNPTFNMLWYSNKNCDYFMLKTWSL